MSIVKEHMASLRAFVESLSYADSISSKQISVLSQKLEDFFEILEELDIESPDDEYTNRPISKPMSSNVQLNSNFDDMDDDLPF